jgi:hypothetical protein
MRLAGWSPVNGPRPRAGGPWSLGLLVLLMIGGGWLRLNQFAHQVLLDDEWHAVHRLLEAGSPAELFLNFGHADYSIPLGLLYWLQSQWFGLTEFGMRLPMLLAGLLTLLVFPVYAWRRFSPRVALLFTALLALSPMLVIYTHTARPYALTLLLTFAGLFGFYRYLERRERALVWGGLYGVCAVLGIWLHPITAPVMAAPFLLEVLRGLAARQAGTLTRLAYLGIPTGLAVALLILPPVLAHPEALSLKAGTAQIGAATLAGAFFMWLGTPSGVCVVAFLVLAGLGINRVLAADRLWQALSLGILLTAAAILLVQPAWADHSLTFGRYLLAAIPVLLLSVACGFERLLAWHRFLKAAAIGMSLVVAGYFLYLSPLRPLIAYPNSHMTHSWFQFDFRSDHNKHAQYMQQTLPESPFWTSLAAAPPGSRRIAVAPFYFESYFWDAPRWERESRQRVVPAFLQGYCTQGRLGEVPRDGRFRFRNAVYLAPPGGTKPVADWLVFMQPVEGFSRSEWGRREIELGQRCLERITAQLGPPAFRDAALTAFRLTD